MLYLIVSTFACGPLYSIETTAGTWVESNYRFSTNRCQFESLLTDSLNLSYTFVASDNAQFEPYEYDTGEEIVDVLNQQNGNMWSLCQENESPDFYCSFPPFLIHFDRWKEGFSPYEASVNTECNLSLSGYAEGLFIDQNTAFVSGSVTVNCLGDIEETSCSANFASDWVKQ